MKQVAIRRRSGTFKINLISNLVLGGLLLSVGVFSFFSQDNVAATEGTGGEIYRSASAENNPNVSLMFNVYWGTEEVYDILTLLEKKNAKATFFIGGCWADDNVQCLREIHAAGHEIGNHGYFHKDHSKLTLTENQAEIARCNEFIELSIGQTPSLYAPPSGAYGNETLSACKALGMKTILWSRDTIDWRDKDSALIYKRATKDIQGGEFVLMHPIKETVNALEKILAYYEERGLRVVSVSENLREKL